MMGARDIIDDVADFLKALILGDFDGDQPVSAQVVSGAIGLIPVVDQVMDVRDIAGCLFRINRKGGFAHATKDDYVMLGFAALGSVPTVGSAFKGIFKPLWKERKAAGKALRSGVEMIERLLGTGKGGAIKWVRALQWGALTQEAIAQINAAIAAMIAMLTWLSTKDRWWVPDSLESLAADALPGIQAMEGKFTGPITQAIQGIREFLEELLGEDASTVAAAAMLGIPSRSAGAKAAGAKRAGRAGSKDGNAPASSKSKAVRHEEIGGQQRAQTDAGHANSQAKTERKTLKDWPNVSLTVQGVVGEHIADYYCLEQKQWGRGSWRSHDQGDGGSWERDPLSNLVAPGKLNDGGKLVQIGMSARGRGIDGVWRKKASGPEKYAVVEAKCYLSPGKSLRSMLDDVYDKNELDAYREARRDARRRMGKGSKRPGGSKRGGSGATSAPTPPQQNPATPQKPPKNVMQMSHVWIQQRLNPLGDAIELDIRRPFGRARNYSRHVVLVSAPQVAEHLQALQDAIENGGAVDPSRHTAHPVTREFGGAEIEAEDRTRANARSTTSQ